MSVDFDLVADAMVFVGGSRCDHAEGYGDSYESEEGVFHCVSCERVEWPMLHELPYRQMTTERAMRMTVDGRC